MKLVGEVEFVECPECRGRGTIPCPKAYTQTFLSTPSTGHPIPCPTCKGKKCIVKT